VSCCHYSQGLMSLYTGPWCLSQCPGVILCRTRYDVENFSEGCAWRGSSSMRPSTSSSARPWQCHCKVQYSTAQHSTVQYSTAQCSAVQYSIVQ